MKPAIIAVLAVTLFLLSGFQSSEFAQYAVAGTEHSLSGYAWSDNIGWISFNCTDTSSCSSSNYGVNVDGATGNFSGYAWSDNIGWVSFNETSGCPNGTCQPRFDAFTNAVSGWVKALGGGTAQSGGWDGWIKLSGTEWTGGVSGAGSDLSGYAWGSDIVGWISFSGAGYAVTGMVGKIDGTCGLANSQSYSNPPTTDLCSAGTPSSVTTNPTTYTWTCSGNGVGGATNAPCAAIRIPPGPTVSLSADPTEVPTNTATELTWVLGGSPTSCTASASPSNSSWTGAKSRTNGSHSQSGIIVPSDTTFSLLCTDSASNSTNASVTVTTVWAPNDGVCEKLKGERFSNSRADCPFRFSEF